MATAGIRINSNHGNGNHVSKPLTPDFELRDEFSICILRPLTDEGRDWINENIDPNHLTFAGGVVIERRYVTDILVGIEDSGLVVAGDQ